MPRVLKHREPEQVVAPEPQKRIKLVKVTLDLPEPLAIRLHGVAYESKQKKSHLAAGILDRGLRVLKADRKYHSGDSESQVPDGEAA